MLQPEHQSPYPDDLFASASMHIDRDRHVEATDCFRDAFLHSVSSLESGADPHLDSLLSAAKEVSGQIDPVYQNPVTIQDRLLAINWMNFLSRQVLMPQGEILNASTELDGGLSLTHLRIEPDSWEKHIYLQGRANIWSATTRDPSLPPLHHVVDRYVFKPSIVDKYNGCSRFFDRLEIASQQRATFPIAKCATDWFRARRPSDALVDELVFSRPQLYMSLQRAKDFAFATKFAGISLGEDGAVSTGKAICTPNLEVKFRTPENAKNFYLTLLFYSAVLGGTISNMNDLIATERFAEANFTFFNFLLEITRKADDRNYLMDQGGNFSSERIQYAAATLFLYDIARRGFGSWGELIRHLPRNRRDSAETAVSELFFVYQATMLIDDDRFALIKVRDRED